MWLTGLLFTENFSYLFIFCKNLQNVPRRISSQNSTQNNAARNSLEFQGILSELYISVKRLNLAACHLQW